MKVAINSEGFVESHHLPAVELSSHLGINALGRVVATDKIKMSVNDFGFPDPKKHLVLVASTLSKDYTVPTDSNNHHLLYQRARFHRRGRGSALWIAREAAAHRIEQPIQIHNYDHWITVDPDEPPKANVEQFKREELQMQQLFRIGRSVISSARWLKEYEGDGAQSFRAAESYAAKHDYTVTQFYDYLDACEDAKVGHMVDRAILSTMGIVAATKFLGNVVHITDGNQTIGARAAISSLESRRIIQNSLGQVA